MQFYNLSLKRALAAIALMATCCTAATAQDLNAKLPTDPNVVTGKLDNGLTYYIRNNHKPENKVELRLIVKAGSILEDDKQLGLAHFMEHMNFNGTTNFQKNDLVSYLQSIGVQFGADLNAYTAFDQTVYILPIPTDKPGNLEKGFQIIEDWAHNALLTDKDIDEERGVVLEESRLGKGADDRMLKIYFPKLAQGSLYADRLPIGKDEILKHFKYDEIRRFYKDWYRPDLQAVAIVGDIDVETAKKMLNEHFAKLKNPANEKPRNYADVKPRTAPDALVVTDKEATNSALMLTYPYETKPVERTLGDYKVNDIEKNLLVQMFNRRLNELAQSSTPPFPFAQADFDDLVHGYRAFTVYTMFSNDGPQKALNAVTAEILKAKKYGFTASELDVAKKDMMSSVEKMYNERNTTDSKNYVEEYIRAFLDEEPYPGIENDYSYYKQLMPGVTVDELNKLFADWVKSPNTFTLITAPDKKDVKLPTAPDLIVMTDKGFHQDVKPTEEKQVATTLMDKKPEAGNLLTKKDDGEMGITYTLSNGVQVTIKQTDFKSDEILLKGVKKGGMSNYGIADRSNVHFATDIVDAMGVGNFTPNDLLKATAGKKIKVEEKLDEIESDIEASSTVKDFESMLQLMYLTIEQPRKDTGLFSAYKQKQKLMLQFITSNPQAAFADTTIKVLFNNNPLARMVFPKASDFDNLNLDRSLQIYKDEFSSADGYHFFLVGNIGPDQALPLLETYLGSLPVTHKTASYKDNGVRTITGNHTIKVSKGKEKKSLILAFYSGEAPYSEDLSLKTQAVAEILNIKVIEDLREKMGSIYGGGFYGNVAKEPYEHYALILQLPCGPENVDKLLAAADVEIKELKAKGPDAKDLDKVKSQWHEKYKTDVKENKFWQDKMESVLFWDHDKSYVTQYENIIDKLTPADIQKTAKQLFNGQNELISILYPEPDGKDAPRGSN